MGDKYIRIMSDTTIMLGFLFFFVLLGVILPFANAAFFQSDNTVNADGVEFAAGENVSTDSVGILDIIISIFTIFFWTFGAIPVIIDLILFVPLRIIFVVLLYRNIRGVG